MHWLRSSHHRATRVVGATWAPLAHVRPDCRAARSRYRRTGRASGAPSDSSDTRHGPLRIRAAIVAAARSTGEPARGSATLGHVHRPVGSRAGAFEVAIDDRG